jgi:uncharacterized protein (DUF433 family)
MDRVVIDPSIRHGKPVIRGTRVPVDVVLGSLASGMSPAEVAQEYGVSLDDVKAALAYASRLISGEEIRSFHAEA